MKKHARIKHLLKSSAGPCQQEARLTFLAFRDTYNVKPALVVAGQRREAQLRAAEKEAGK
jgi:hypothetical protein